MAKSRFKIPVLLDVSYFDMEFNVKNKNGIGLSKPVSAKVVFLTLVAAFMWFYAIFNTFIGKNGLIYAIVFSVAWIMISVLLIKIDKTGRIGLELVLSALSYVPKSMRRTATRLADNAYPLASLLNIKDIDEEDGLIHYNDKTIGYVYHVVGSASSLMFDQDRHAIIDKVDSFYRKLPVGVEVIYDTVYEAQRVDKQLESLHADHKQLKTQSPGLEKLYYEKAAVLDVIANGAGLRSLHQYLVVKAPTQELLREFESLLYGDVEERGLMFRYAKPLDYDETTRYFKQVVGE